MPLAIKPIPLLDLSVQHAALAEELKRDFARVLASGQFVLGAEHDVFERELAAACGVRHAIGLASGTAAISIGLQGLGVEPGDDVVVPAFTYFATASAVAHVGARPVFADVEDRRYGIDPRALEAAITPRTKAIVPVHLYGLPADLAPIRSIAAARGIAVLEDAAQAIGAEYRGAPVGSVTAGAALSFFPTKNLGGLGDAGALLTNDDRLAERARLLRVHGDAGDYRHLLLGTNARLDALQAAFLRTKLRFLNGWIDARRAIASQYRTALAGAPVALPAEPADSRHTYHQFTVCAPDRDRLRARLAECGIASRIYYPLTVPSQPCFLDRDGPRGSFPTSERLAAQVLSLPIYPGLPVEDVLRVAAAIHAFYGTAPEAGSR